MPRFKITLTQVVTYARFMEADNEEQARDAVQSWLLDGDGEDDAVSEIGSAKMKIDAIEEQKSPRGGA